MFFEIYLKKGNAIVAFSTIFLFFIFLFGSSQNYLFVGDFNFPSIDWQQMACPDTVSKSFLNACNNKFLTQHVDFPTHIAGNTLDLVMSSNPDLIGNVWSIGPLANGDHDMIMLVSYLVLIYHSPASYTRLLHKTEAKQCILRLFIL